MKLIRCHIENFGVLSDFDFSFAEGLTTICQSNGFGKSTFAAFIKAMFYGFPRTGARNIVENERKRYDPWQGGKYGGYLEFEVQDVSYRVTRYFGKTAAKDTFSLLDLTNRRPSTRFSEKLGEELFQLDADSFARSTYVPQLSANDIQATTSIRTKLSNLVDDTNDLRNYDTAEKKLRDYRTKFRAYRGEGGAINEIIRERLRLENDKYKADQLRPGLQEVVESIERLNGEKAIKTDAVNNLREKIRLASDQKVRIANQKQLNSLRLEVEKKQQYLQEMDEGYPVGYPTAEEIKEQRENLSIIQQEGQRLQALKLSDADKEITEGEQHWFANTEQVAADIEQCDRDCKELGEVSAKMTAQMLPEELERLNALSKRFTAGIPTEVELQTCMTAADDLSDAQRQYAELSVSAENQKCLAQLQELFRSGIPDDSALSDCEQTFHDRDVLIQSRSAHVFPDNEQKQYDALKRTFAAGVPAEEEIQSKQTDSRRIAELTAKKNTQTTIIQQDLPQEPSEPSKAPLVCGGVGAALLVFGIICFVMQLSIPGIILLVAGFVALLTAFWLHTKSIVNNQTRSSASVITASAISDEENQELYNLQHALNDFLLRFYGDAADPDNKLVQLRIDSKAYADLHEKKLAAEDELREIDAKIHAKNEEIQSMFERYYPHDTYRDDFVKRLRDSLSKYQRLTEEARTVSARRDDLKARIEDDRSKIIPVLHRYYPIELPKDLRQGIRTLSSEVTAYNELKAKKKAMLDGNAKYQERADALKASIRKILLTYKALDQALPYDTCLQNLRKRFDRYKEASERVTHYTQELENSTSRKNQANAEVQNFLQKYQLSDDTPENLIDYADDDSRSREATKKALGEAQHKLNTFMEENSGVEADIIDIDNDLADPEVLQESEKQLQDKIGGIEAELRDLRQERDRIRRSVENIPAWEDRMSRLQNEQEEDERKCALADQTLALLSQAKDNLANSYVGRVERGFENYANTLMGNQLGDVMVDKDLHLYIDEKGAAREVGSFSAGTIDCIMLCMRLSLVDALFGDEKPFLILDDPFVNLDDEHTKRALEMLDRIAQDHQVVYLVCNTSRK